MYTAIVADDEKLICNSILSVLGTAVSELKILRVFHDGAEAFDYLVSNHADILLLDIQMPKKSGLDIAQLIREKGSDSYIIIITAHQDFDYAKRAIDCNVNAFLTKPFTSRQMVDAVQKGIDYFEKKLVAYVREMDYFFQLVSENSSTQAKKHLARYIKSLPVGELISFKKFLEDNYQITSTSTDTNSIIQSLDDLTKRSNNIQSGNYVVNSACEYINKNYASSSLSLESVAGALSVSSVYLSRAFKKYLNQNFSDYLLHVRMEQAKQLLQSTYLSTAEIAAAVGYDNPAYFRTSFKSYYSVTPKQYRLSIGRKESNL